MHGNKLIIVDISNFIFRAFYAIRSLHSPQGVPVNAVHGVMSMLLKLVAEYRPTHLVLARDTREEKTFRKEIYAEYKANRSETPEDLIPQFSIIEQLTEKMQIVSITLPGFEADDIIGSLAIQWQKDFDEILIASSDKDLMQFVSDKIKIVDTMKDKIYKRDDVLEKMGVFPEQIVDYLTLVGDASDNIPGVKGIGAKTAEKLLAEYKTLDNCLAHVGEIANKKARESLTNAGDDLELSRKLINIKIDLNLPVNVEKTKYTFNPDNALIAYLKEYGLVSLAKKMHEYQYQDHKINTKSNSTDDHNFAPPVLNNHSVDRVQVTEQNIDEICRELTNKAECSICLFTDNILFSIDETKLFILAKDNLSLVKKILALDLTWYSDDAKSIFHLFLDCELPLPNKIFDLLQMHFIANADKRHTLPFMVQEYLGQIVASEEENIVFGASLFNKLNERLKQEATLSVYDKIDFPLIKILTAMERTGVYINPQYLNALAVDFQKELENIRLKVCGIIPAEFQDINLNSPKQLSNLLFEVLKLPVIRKTKTGYSTDSDVLQELAAMGLSPLPELLLSHREIEKLLNTYVTVLPTLTAGTTRRLHTRFTQNVAATGRLSSIQPNLQNIPIRSENGRKIRKAFIAPPGKLLLGADYSQIELRLLAHFSSDPVMVSAFLKDEDIHAQTAAEVLGKPITQITNEERSIAKTVNFGLMYGQSSFGLATTLKISREEAKNYIMEYFQKFSTVKIFLDSLKEEGEKHGYTTTISGRKRYVPEINSSNRNIKNAAERVAVNTPIQGSAADIIKLAMIKINERMVQENLSSCMVLQVHDELIFEVPENEITTMKSLVQDCMENVITLRVPLKVNIGLGINWLELK